MANNLKTLGFFLVLAALCVVPYFNKAILHGKNIVHAESENARELYTGKTRDVYNPLDESFKITDSLKDLIKKEETLDFTHYKVWPVVSVMVDPDDLYHEERGIFANPFKVGRLWERASHITYYEKGQKRFSSIAGVRVHGGGSRRLDDRSLRFYFKKSYGEESFLTDLGIGLKDNTPVKNLVLRRDSVHHFANDFSFSMINRLGGIAPRIKHVAVYINGEFYQFMQMMEHLHEEQAKYYFGHERFLFNKLKGSNPPRDRLLYENAIHKAKGARKPISYKKMQELFDLDSVTANLITIMYTGTTDWAQGVWVKDLVTDKKWKLISWDFDFAFYKRKGKNTEDMSIPNWEIDSYKAGSTQHIASLRSIIFNRLMKESPEYREVFLKKVDQMFRLIETDSFWKEKLELYESLAADTENNARLNESISVIKEFVENRKPFFCRQMQEEINTLPESC